MCVFDKDNIGASAFIWAAKQNAVEVMELLLGKNKCSDRLTTLRKK